MLILSRKKGQAIVVGGEITITLVGIHKGRAQLAIEAPAGVSVRSAGEAGRPKTKAVIRRPHNDG